MPVKKFLEEYPLYRSFGYEPRSMIIRALDRPGLNMPCAVCSGNQTFNMINKYDELNSEIEDCRGKIFRIVYNCAHCRNFQRTFFVLFQKGKDDEHVSVMKVGQFPTWDISVEKEIDKLLGDKRVYYHRGKILESQSYGIGAYGYYRRIVEMVIDDLLQQIDTLLSPEEKAQYEAAIEKTKKSTIAQEKIAVVKDLLPPILRPNNINPLGVLHDALSRGIHAMSDEDCLTEACLIRESLTYLVSQLEVHKHASAGFSSSIKQLLEIKSKKGT